MQSINMKSIKPKLQVLALAAAMIPAAALFAQSKPAAAPAAPAAAGAETADQIMVKVDRATRRAYDTQVATVKITTCKYTLKDGAVRCSEKPRIVQAENVKKNNYDNNQYHVKSLLLVREPASDRGTGLLVYEYPERGRDNDNWLYLPALGKVNRVIANNDEGGSVFGSEFSVETSENPEARKLEDWTYRIVESSTYQNRPVWVIELTPTAEKARKTSYKKVVAWIDKEYYLAVKEDLYRGNKIHKTRTQSDIKKIDGVVVVTKTVVNNRTTSRVSQMDMPAIAHNRAVPEDFVTQRALTDFPYRERNLAVFRSYLGQAAVN